MKYIIELDSPDAQMMLDMLTRSATSAASLHATYRSTNGRGHPATVHAGRRVKSCDRVVAVVRAAIAAAEPERSTGTNEGALMSDPDDMFQATSRPMGMGRRKASNLRRKRI